MFRRMLAAVLCAATMLCGSTSFAADFSSHKVAVVYYSLLHNRVGGDDFAAEHTQGNTEKLAAEIAQQTGGKLISLTQVKKYPNDYDEAVDIAREEQSDNARPELTSVPDVSDCDVVFVCYPCWWGSYPMAYATWFDTGALAGKTVVAVTTHEGSRFGRSLRDLRAALPDSTVIEGLQMRGGTAEDISAEDLTSEVRDFLSDLELE